MKKIFKKLSDQNQIDLIKYLKNNIKDNDKIFIGTDSQNVGNETIYATVIIIHNKTRGGHVLYSKEKVKKINDHFRKLWKEVEDSIEVAIYLKKNNLPKVDYIDLDLNPDPKYRSNTVLRDALGYVESMGFKARIKPYAIAASCVADLACH